MKSFVQVLLFSAFSFINANTSSAQVIDFGRGGGGLNFCIMYNHNPRACNDNQNCTYDNRTERCEDGGSFPPRSRCERYDNSPRACENTRDCYYDYNYRRCEEDRSNDRCEYYDNDSRACERNRNCRYNFDDRICEPARRSRLATIIFTCGSQALGSDECATPGPIVSYQLTRQISQSRCVLGQTYGAYRSAIWTDQSCRAEFTVQYEQSGL